MNRIIVVLSVLISVMVLTACSNEQIKEAIESCKGDPECYEIVDSAIEEELTSRGITSGKMNNQELEQVYDLIEEYTLDFELYGSEEMRIVKSHMLQSFVNHLYNYGYSNEDMYELNMAVTFLSNSNLELLRSFKTVNSENIQLVIEDGMKYVLYKESSSRFILEISGDQIINFTFDLDLNKLYFDNTALSPMIHVENLFNGDYNQEKLVLFNSNEYIGYCYQSENENEFLVCESNNLEYTEISFTVEETTFTKDEVEVEGYRISFSSDIFQINNGQMEYYFEYYNGDIADMLSDIENVNGFYVNEGQSYDFEEFTSLMTLLEHFEGMVISIPSRD